MNNQTENEINKAISGKRWLATVLVGAGLLLGGHASGENDSQAAGPFLFQGVAVHEETIAFALAGRIWLVHRNGGTAHSITNGKGDDRLPVFSPDGSQLAFARMNSGEGDVFIYSTSSEKTVRRTFHPAMDWPVAFSPAGDRLLFVSTRDNRRMERLYEIAKDAHLPRALPFPMGADATYSPDGKKIAYLPYGNTPEFNQFRYYRGGMTSQIYIAAKETGPARPITSAGVNARSPIWLGEKIVYLSDESGIFNLYVRAVNGGPARQLTQYTGQGIRAAAAQGTNIVFTRGGFLYQLDLAGGRPTRLPLAVPLDMSMRRMRLLNAVGFITSMSMHNNSGKATFVAHGDAFSVDMHSAKAVNLTKTTGVAEREAVLSRDGQQLAYFSDATGSYQLYVRNLASNSLRVIEIEKQSSFYQELTWSPDGSRLSFSDQRLSLWRCDVETGQVLRVDRSEDPGQVAFNASWSPGGRWLVYENRGADRLPSLFIHDAHEGTNRQVTRGVYATSPAFDNGGRYLYFLSSPNASGSDYHWSVLHGLNNGSRIVSNLNAFVLRQDDPGPLHTASLQPNLAVDWQPATETLIDFEGLATRVVPLRVESHQFYGLVAGKPGSLYLLSHEWPPSPKLGEQPRSALFYLDLRNPTKLAKVVHSLTDLATAADGLSGIYNQENGYRTFVRKGGDFVHASLRIGALPARSDTSLQWAQIFEDAWRYLREHLYDPNFHGLDIEDLKAHYLAFLPNITRRAELTTLIRRMFGDISVSHMGVSGGDRDGRTTRTAQVGLLGTDYRLEQGRYQFVNIQRRVHFDDRRDETYAPLDQPGAKVAEGEWLLAIDGKPVTGARNIFRVFEGLANRQVRLKVGPSIEDSDAREIIVHTIDDEHVLRMANWAEANRKSVAELSGGQLAYLHIDGYNAGGIESFLRGYYAARGHLGLIIDQRFNGGGITADALIDMFRREPIYAYLFRNGQDLPTPVNSFQGSKVLITNQWNGSAAETFALMFRLAKIGPIVGRRTFGAGIGPYGYALRLMDGGRIRIPNRGAFDPAGNWGIENTGVAPHISVAITAEAWAAGPRSPIRRSSPPGNDEKEKRQKIPPSTLPQTPLQAGSPGLAVCRRRQQLDCLQKDLALPWSTQ